MACCRVVGRSCCLDRSVLPGSAGSVEVVHELRVKLDEFLNHLRTATAERTQSYIVGKCRL